MSQNTSPPRPGMEGPMLAFRFMDLAPILLEALKFSLSVVDFFLVFLKNV